MALPPPKTLRSRPTMLVAFAAFTVVAVAVFVAYQAATDPSPYRRVLDELRFPEAWSVPHPDVEDRMLLAGAGSQVTRFYLVDAEPTETVLVVEAVVTDAGFTVDHSSCHRNPSNGPIESCTVAAIRDRIHLWIVIYARGKRVPYSFQGGEPTAGAPNLSVVRVQAGAGY